MSDPGFGKANAERAYCGVAGLPSDVEAACCRKVAGVERDAQGQDPAVTPAVNKLREEKRSPIGRLR